MTGLNADGSLMFMLYGSGGIPGMPMAAERLKGRKNGAWRPANDLTDAAAAASMADGFVRFDSKLKLCLLLKSDEFGVCGGVSRGLATSQKPEALAK